MGNNLVNPHGGILINCFNTEKLPETQYEIIISNETVIDIKNIGNGTYSPLNGFLKKNDFISVCKNMRLENGILWSIPIVLDISKEQKNEIESSNVEYISLIDQQGNKIAIIKNEEIYSFNREDYANYVFGTTDIEHPGVSNIYSLNELLIGGKIILLNNNKDKVHNLSPIETRKIFEEKGWKTIAAFQTRNPPHISHEYLQKCALEGCDGLYINPVVGKKKTGDFVDKYIVGAYEILIRNYFNKEHVLFGSLTLNMKYAGPREAILHAIIRQNHGCSHLIIGRDHAGVGSYYGHYDAQNIFDKLRVNDLEINILKYENAGLCTICKTVTTNKTCPHSNENKVHISGTEVRRRIKAKEILPGDFMRKEISEYLIEGKNQFVN